MNNKIKIITVVIITALASGVLTWNIKDKFDASGAFYSSNDKIKTIENLISNNYLYDYDEWKSENEAAKAYVDALEEPYTEYYTADEFQSYISNIQNGYVGVGVVASVDDNDNIVVIAPIEGSPAYECGILPMDVLKSVDGTEYAGSQLSEAVAHIKNGSEGTTVDLTFIRNSQEEINVTLERKNIETPTVSTEMIEDGIGYIRISEFDMKSETGEESTYSEFKRKAEELTSNGMKKMIIDLRGNPGGVLTEACSIADMILPEGVITYTETKDGKKKYYNSDEECMDIPIVVLINGSSASASEVLTGALKDYGKATIVGTTSYGKGIVQDVYTFADGSGISLTTAKYYTPNGICIHGTGIEPDVESELPDEYKDYYISMLSREQDTQLQKALEVIRGK